MARHSFVKATLARIASNIRPTKTGKKQAGVLSNAEQ